MKESSTRREALDMGHLLANEAVQMGGLGAIFLMIVAGVIAMFTKN
ncbi:hypothetical protein [Nocardioides dilutus]